MSAIPWLLHGFSTRPGGVSTAYGRQRRGELNLGFTASDDSATVAANRELFLGAVTGDPFFPLITTRQIHSATVRRVSLADAAPDSNLAEADGLITDEPGILLGIQTADCIPVLLVDQRTRAVAAFHAGWRGTLRGIVEEGVHEMCKEFDTRAEDLVAAIGPGIGPCCYRVGEEVRSVFASRFLYAGELFRGVDAEDGQKLHLDLIEANRRQLLDAGLMASSITIVGECTSCRTDRYFSYRAEQGSTGRMLSAIGMRPG